MKKDETTCVKKNSSLFALFTVFTHSHYEKITGHTCFAITLFLGNLLSGL